MWNWLKKRINPGPQMCYQGNPGLKSSPEGFRYSNTCVFQHPENIIIGKDVFIWHYAILDGTASLHIGDGCAIGGWVGIFTHSVPQAIRLYGYHYREFNEAEKLGFISEPVHIGAFCNIGPHTIIQHGCIIGKGSLLMPGCILEPGTHIPAFSAVNRDGKVIGDTRNLDKPMLDLDPKLKLFYEEWTKK